MATVVLARGIRIVADYVYSIQMNITAIVGGHLTIGFWPFQEDASPIAIFSGGFGGIVAGTGVGWGTAWLNYDVKMMFDNGWDARFEANFLPVAANVNLWGMSGEVIGNTATGGIGALAGVVGGQGRFISPTSDLVRVPNV
jgi:hypothetical protein